MNSAESIGTDHNSCNWEIQPADVHRMRCCGEDFLLLDCRTPEEYELARIEGATLIPLQELSVRIGELQPHADRLIVVHCHRGKRSLTVTAVLRELGFENVRSMAGGIHRWSEEIDPSIPRY